MNSKLNCVFTSLDAATRPIHKLINRATRRDDVVVSDMSTMTNSPPVRSNEVIFSLSAARHLDDERTSIASR